MPIIVEIKASCKNPEAIHAILKQNNARYVGQDHQVDTYFQVTDGRLKLREGEIENNLIHYHRPNQEGPKTSTVSLYKPNVTADLKNILRAVLGEKVCVDKLRHIYFIENVKFHIDEVKSLGNFVEIEAIEPADSSMDEAQLLAQCRHYMELFKLDEADLISCSYSDLLLETS